MEKEFKRKTRWQRIKLRYQFNIMNEETYEVKSVFSFSMLNLVIWAFMFALLIGLASYAIIAFTPIKQYVPGYGKVDDRRLALEHQLMADSISLWASNVERKMEIIEHVLKGDLDTGIQTEDLFNNNYDSLDIFSYSKEDSLLRIEVEQRERFSIFDDEEETSGSLSEIIIYPPVKGVVSDSFNTKEEHYGIDIVATHNNEVKSILDGRVVLSEFTIETGYVIAVQHDANILSIYKHNSKLNRKVGNFIQQGEVIAVSGNTGEWTNGSHLHFELWYNGEPVDPVRFIDFE
ncbi:MAG: M23 family metallopeptidase [Bacteroidetes bacterium]|nr:M23 family metallopeptidase [Bacteroidota bacterium]